MQGLRFRINEGEWVALGTDDCTFVQLKLNTTGRVTLSEEVSSAVLVIFGVDYVERNGREAVMSLPESFLCLNNTLEIHFTDISSPQNFAGVPETITDYSKVKNFLLPREPDFFVGYELSYNNGPAITCGREDIEILSFSLTKSKQTQSTERHDRFLATVGGVPMSATPNGEFVAWFHQGLSPGDYIRIKVIETKCSAPSFILQE